MGLTPEQASQILDADTRNLVKRVQEGKTLSSTERTALENIAKNKPVASSMSELSKILDCSRQSLYNWREEEGAPSDLNIEAWRIFMEQREAMGGKGTGRLLVGGRQFSSQDMVDLRGLLLEEQTKRQMAERKLREIELAKTEKGWIPLSEAKDTIRRVLEPLSSLLGNFPKRYAIRVDPTNPERAEKVLRECVNEVIRQMHADRGKKLGKRNNID